LVKRARRAIVLIAALAIAAVVTGGSVARADHYGCQEITVWLLGSEPMKRDVCYPCAPATSLPAVTPPTVRLFWNQQICPPVAGPVLPSR